MLKLVFALPEEARVVRRRVRGAFGGQVVSLSFVGVGAGRMAELERSVELTKPRMVISSGFAGATRSLLEAGDFVLSTNYTDADIAEFLGRQKIFDAAGPFFQVQQVASASAKWSLNHSQGALAVDMESVEIANLCRRKAIPLVTARMISDAIDEAIPAIFSKRKFSGLKDLGDATVFAARMLRLTGKLADRLEALVGALPRSGER